MKTLLIILMVVLVIWLMAHAINFPRLAR